MKLTKETLKQIIKEELEATLSEMEMDQEAEIKALMRKSLYGVVGNVQLQPKDFGRYTMNNGVIGIVPAGKTRGFQWYPYSGNGNPRAIFAKLKEMGFEEEGMALDRSNNSEESLRKIASKS